MQHVCLQLLPNGYCQISPYACSFVTLFCKKLAMYYLSVSKVNCTLI